MIPFKVTLRTKVFVDIQETFNIETLVKFPAMMLVTELSSLFLGGGQLELSTKIQKTCLLSKSRWFCNRDSIDTHKVINNLIKPQFAMAILPLHASNIVHFYLDHPHKVQPPPSNSDHQKVFSLGRGSLFTTCEGVGPANSSSNFVVLIRDLLQEAPIRLGCHVQKKHVVTVNRKERIQEYDPNTPHLQVLRISCQ